MFVTAIMNPLTPPWPREGFCGRSNTFILERSGLTKGNSLEKDELSRFFFKFDTRIDSLT